MKFALILMALFDDGVYTETLDFNMSREGCLQALAETPVPYGAAIMCEPEGTDL